MAFKEINARLVEVKTSNLTGGTINIAANVVCKWPVIRAYLSDHMAIILTE